MTSNGLTWIASKKSYACALWLGSPPLYRHHRELHEMMQRIRIVKRGAAGSLLMSSYLDELQWDHLRLLPSSSAYFAALHARGGPSAHPRVWRYTQLKRVSSRRPASPQNIKSSSASATRDSFGAHFRSVTQSGLRSTPIFFYDHPI